MFLDDSWNGLNLKIARDIRDKINSLLHEELIEWCIEYEIDHLNMTDEEMRMALKKSNYEDLAEEEIELLNKEQTLTDEEIEKFNREKIYGILC